MEVNEERKWYKFYWTHGWSRKRLAGMGFGAILIGAILKGAFGDILVVFGFGLLVEAAFVRNKK